MYLQRIGVKWYAYYLFVYIFRPFSLIWYQLSPKDVISNNIYRWIVTDEMENVGLINLIFQSKCFHFVFAAHNEGLGRICFRRKNYAMHSSNLKSKMWDCWKTNFIPIISVFTLVNSELRNISNDQMTLKYLILNYLRCLLSFVIFAFILSCQYLVWFLCRIFSSRVFVPSVGCAYENVCSPRCNLTHKVTRLMMT